MADLETQLRAAADARFRLIVTDGVFSMDGTYARLAEICDLAERYDALVMVDDSHAVGFVGERGAGTPELQGVEGRVHITTGTFGKALGGASGGYITGPQAFIDLLRQRARPYLFSNSLAPSIVQATLAALELIENSSELRRQLADSTVYFRDRMVAAGFDVIPGEHAIVPIMTGDARLAQQLASGLMELGIFVTAFSFPVVPKGQARVRTQISAALSREQIDSAITAFTTVGRQVGLIPAGEVQ
jgi:glycine C-acetyltransferase